MSTLLHCHNYFTNTAVGVGTTKMEGNGNYPYRIAYNDPGGSNYGSSSYLQGMTDQSGFAAYGGNPQNFEVSEFFKLEDWMEEDPALMGSFGYAQSPQDEVVIRSSGSTSQPQQHDTAKRDGGSSGKEKKEIREKIAFKTQSDIEILDDGFKWRKYGKKMVKNSPNPRNYYRCSVDGCSVKKRVERDKDDQRYVITTYEGTHNHEGPSQF